MNNLFSPEVISMVVGIIAALLVALIPQLEAVKTELITLLTVLVGLVIGAFGLERAAAARSSGSTMAERASVKPYAAPTVRTPTP